MEKKRLPFFTKLCYGIGTLGYSSMSNTLGNFVMFFGTSIMGISGTLVGIAVAISSLWDGISDPLVGNLSDNTHSKVFGRRHGYMLLGAIIVALCNILIWAMPSSAGQGTKFIWLLTMLLAIETACTFWSTPYSALGIDIAPDYNEQSKIQGFKTVFSIIGMILPSVLMYFFMPSITIGIQTQFSQSGYRKISYINSSLMLFCGLIAILGTFYLSKKTNNLAKIDEKSQKNREKSKFSQIFNGYFDILKKKDFRAIILGYSAATVASAFLMSVGMHLFTYCYHFSSTQISFILICLFGFAILSQPLWVAVSKRYDKKKALIIALSTILLGLSLMMATFVLRNNLSPNMLYFTVLPCLMTAGIGLGAMYSLPMSMYADVVTLEMYKTGQNSAGSYSGFYSFTYNIANSVSLLVIGLLLDFIKFDPTQPLQALSVQNGLGTIVFCGCAIALATSICIFSTYSVKRADVLRTQLKINISQKEKG